MADQNKKILNCFKPVYDELTTYVITLTCMLLVISRPELREKYGDAWSIVRYKEVVWLIGISGLALFGAFLSIFHVFARRPKESWEKTAMASIAMGANGTAGVALGMELLPQGWTMWAIFPIWNIVTGSLLLYQIGLRPEDSVTDEDVSLEQVGMATVALLAVFFICEWYLKLTWPMTFSVSVAYASISGYLFKRKGIPSITHQKEQS